MAVVGLQDNESSHPDIVDALNPVLAALVHCGNKQDLPITVFLLQYSRPRSILVSSRSFANGMRIASFEIVFCPERTLLNISDCSMKNIDTSPAL